MASNRCESVFPQEDWPYVKRCNNIKEPKQDYCNTCIEGIENETGKSIRQLKEEGRI